MELEDTNIFLAFDLLERLLSVQNMFL